MLIKASIGDVLETEQSLQYAGKDRFSWPSILYRFLICVRAEAKKPDYISMTSVPQAKKLPTK